MTTIQKIEGKEEAQLETGVQKKIWVKQRRVAL